MTPDMVLMSAYVFLPVALGAFAALRNAWEPVAPPAEKPAPALLRDFSPDLLFGVFTYHCACLWPTTAYSRTQIYQDLRTAGYYRPVALTEYVALRNLLTLLPLLVGVLLTLSVETEDIPAVAIVGVFLAVLGFSLPRLYIQAQGRNRSHRIERALPTGVDLLTLALTAGLNLQAALDRVVTELRFSFPELAEELAITQRQAQLHTLEHALEELAERVRIPEVRNLALILAQSERLGTDATGVLLEVSNNLRTSMRQRAETQANRASFWMLFPTVGCFLIASGLILVGPVFLEFRRQETATRQLLQEGRKQVEKVNPGAPGVKAATKGSAPPQ